MKGRYLGSGAIAAPATARQTPGKTSEWGLYIGDLALFTDRAGIVELRDAITAALESEKP